MHHEHESYFNGLYVVAKFYHSKSPEGRMLPISRTLGKLGIVPAEHEEKIKDQDIWLCQIQEESKPGINAGAFILSPVKQIDPSRIRKLIPGFYDVHPVGKAALIVPKTDAEHYWILSKATRRMFSEKYHAVVVPCSVSAEDVVEQILTIGDPESPQ